MLLTSTAQREEPMNINRRSALSLGSVGLAAAAATPLLALATPAGAAGIQDLPNYGPDDGAELSPRTLHDKSVRS